MASVLIGSSRFNFSTLTSTNQFATELLSKTRPRAGTVISAEFQTRGKGQYGRSWFGSKGKNLYVSVILYPGLEPAQQFRISAFAALGVRQTVEELCGAQAMIKWPNDIYVNDRKVAGILIQNTLAGRQIQHSVVGIGVNINEQEFPEALPNPLAVNSLNGKDIDLHYARQQLIDNLNIFYKSTLENDLAFVRNIYEKHLYLNGKNAQFEMSDDGGIFGATIEGVDEFGRLRVKQNKESRVYSLNEIRFVK